MMKSDRMKQKGGLGANQTQIGTFNQQINVLTNSELFENLLAERKNPAFIPVVDYPGSSVSLELKDLEKLNLISVFSYSLTPWKRSAGLLFGEICNTQYCIEPHVTLGNLESDNKTSFSKSIDILKDKRCIILGDAGCGKSFAMRKICIDLLTKDKHALYISAQDWNNGNIIAKYIDDVLNHRILPPEDLLILFDGIDEVFATNHTELAQLINNANTIKCTIWFGCRTDYYDSAQCFDSIPYQRVYLQEWTPEQSLLYVNEYAKKSKKNITEKYNYLLDQNNCIESFYKNPLRLSMLIYILETDDKELQLHNNEYLLYSMFFSQWINNELTRSKEFNIDEETIFVEWQKIARTLYIDRYSEISVNNSSILVSILKVTKASHNNYKVNDFLHRSFMEFLLAKEAIDSMLKSPHEVINTLKYNNRSDVDFYIKKAFINQPPVKKNKIVSNLISAYREAENELSSESEIFYVHNQIVYYLTRMNSKNATIKSFIMQSYKVETRPIMRQGIAYGAANIGILDVALDFAKRMDDPNSTENLTNRAWTLIFYGDQPDEDPLEYEDIHNVSWQRSKDARLRRLQGNKPKDQAFRMFDLCVLHGFYESRGWNEFSKHDLDIIKNTEINIKGYNSDIIDFLRKKQQDLIDNYFKINTI